MGRSSGKYSEEERYKLVRHVIYLMKRSGKIKTVAYGEENLPKEGGYVMYPNHQGKYDALGIISTHKEPCSLVMDEAKSHTILVSEFVDLLQGKRLIKDNVRQALKIITEVSEDVKNGKKYILFQKVVTNSITVIVSVILKRVVLNLQSKHMYQLYQLR